MVRYAPGNFFIGLFGKRHWIVTPFLVLYLVFILVYYLIFLAHPLNTIGSDLISFLTGAEIVKEGKGELLYNLQTQYGYQLEVIKPYQKSNLLPFRGLPFLAFLFIPLTYFPLFTAYKLFIIVNTLVLVTFLMLSSRFFKFLNDKKLFYLLPLSFFPVVTSIVIGQYVTFLLLIIFFIYSYLKDDRPFYAGILGGLLLIKPQFLLLVPFLILITKGKTKFIFGFLSSSAAIFLFSLLLFKGEFVSSYLSFLSQTETPAFGSRYWHMFSFYGALQSLFPLVDRNIFLVLNGFLYVFSLYLFNRKISNLTFDRLFSIGILFTSVFSLHTLVHDLIVFLIPIFILLSELFSQKTKSQVKFYLRTILITLYFLPLIILSGRASISALVILFIAFLLLFPKSNSNILVAIQKRLDNLLEDRNSDMTNQ